MTVTRVPARNPEPEVPITDPRWLVSTQPDPTPEIDGGLDGRGTTHAADLPARVWDATWPQRVPEDIDLDATPTVLHRLCLEIDTRGGDWPGRCGDPRDHAGLHDWERAPGDTLRENRMEQLRDTPSGRLPVRTPGAALEEEREVVETWTA